MIHFGEKGGKSREISVRHDLGKMMAKIMLASNGMKDIHLQRNSERESIRPAAVSVASH